LPHLPALTTTLSYGEFRIKKETTEENFIIFGEPPLML